MFEFGTDQFRNRVHNAINSEMAKLGIRSYDKENILDFLQEKAKSNEIVIWNEESQKTDSARRDVNIAVTESIQKLVKLAAAKAGTRNNLTLDDMSQAYWENFCQFWPFCKGQ